MTIVCDLVRQASQGLQGAGTLGNLVNALNALSIPDISIRLGSRGKAGLFDLPFLLNEKGIECYSPELGDSIYVTPLQWYANGMSCSGLRDPDREALQKP
ncbi:hypothetical protein [Microseira wollei]|uniref:Carbohydrate kinase PfkB domain-containing protein n=1 Tax=Microseira wollei NIES-4236 TaxID=2530354 RepID=A0AAV3XRK9_9CYAN|nr:hypothetical protein [Microseira wollei]GET43000.1 hypothetical protein MiSe_78200 [Microseira wollei NIES-4236]